MLLLPQPHCLPDLTVLTFYAYENPWASSFFLKHFSGGMKGAQTDRTYYCTNSLLLKGGKMGWRETVNMATLANISNINKTGNRNNLSSNTVSGFQRTGSPLLTLKDSISCLRQKLS